MPSTLTAGQQEILNTSFETRIFLEGPAGAGKTTAGTERLMQLLENGVPGDEILVLVPQRTLAIPYYEILNDPGLAAGSVVSIFTLGGLARNMVELFWPIASKDAGFAAPDQPPVFLNLETAQYHMARIVDPLLDQGYFEGIALDRNRLYSQVLDNLNKAAFVGFPHTEIGRRLNAAWIEDSHQRRVYNDVQTCATRFREYCLQHNLLEFSLTLETFLKHIFNNPLGLYYLIGRYSHIIVDNIEEDTPAAHDVLLEWLPHCYSALVIYDWEAGYRQFLGADPPSAHRLKEICSEHLVFPDSLITSPEVEALRASFSFAMNRPAETLRDDAGNALNLQIHRFYPEMISWVTDRITDLVNNGTSPGEIVVLAPYLSDALRFSLVNRLEADGVPVQSHRPSRSLREEPATQCLLTLAALAHPQWDIQPAPFDIAYALRQALDDLDLVRAQLLSEILYRTPESGPMLYPFEQVKPEMQARITYLHGGRYDALRLWLETYRDGSPEPLDHFFSRLFGQLLSQPGFGFHQDFDAGTAAANLIDSAREFRQVVGPQLKAEEQETGSAFLQTVHKGLLASQYIRSWDLQREDAVLLAPAYTFLMNNRPVEYQFWLNVTSKGWYERLNQPLTHPYVLSRRWRDGEVWTDQHEIRYNEENMYRVINGLLRRCRSGIFLGLSELDEHGFEQKGPLLPVLQKVLRDLYPDS